MCMNYADICLIASKFTSVAKSTFQLCQFPLLLRSYCLSWQRIQTFQQSILDAFHCLIVKVVHFSSIESKYFPDTCMRKRKASQKAGAAKNRVYSIHDDVFEVE